MSGQVQLSNAYLGAMLNCHERRYILSCSTVTEFRVTLGIFRLTNEIPITANRNVPGTLKVMTASASGIP